MPTDHPVQMLTRTDHPEAVVLQIVTADIREGNLSEIRAALDQATASISRSVILDLSQVSFLTSAAVGLLIKFRRHLLDQGGTFQPPCRRRGLFAMYPNAEIALDAVRRGETEPLILCGANAETAKIFIVC